MKQQGYTRFIQDDLQGFWIYPERSMFETANNAMKEYKITRL